MNVTKIKHCPNWTELSEIFGGFSFSVNRAYLNDYKTYNEIGKDLKTENVAEVYSWLMGEVKIPLVAIKLANEFHVYDFAFEHIENVGDVVSFIIEIDYQDRNDAKRKTLEARIPWMDYMKALYYRYATIEAFFPDSDFISIDDGGDLPRITSISDAYSEYQTEFDVVTAAQYYILNQIGGGCKYFESAEEITLL